jgi:hypothetical protein
MNIVVLATPADLLASVVPDTPACSRPIAFSWSD